MSKRLQARIDMLVTASSERLRRASPSSLPDIRAAVAALHEALGGDFAKAATMLDRVRTGNMTEADRIAMDLLGRDVPIETMFGTAEVFLRTVADVDKRA